MNCPPSCVFRLTARIAVFATVALSTIVESPAQAPIIQPGAPGEPSREISAEEAADLASIHFTEADVKFMQGMISHHAQALEMTSLVESRTNREAIRLLSRRIELSQEDEIAMMQGWLRDRNLMVTDLAAHHAPSLVLVE